MTAEEQSAFTVPRTHFVRPMTQMEYEVFLASRGAPVLPKLLESFRKRADAWERSCGETGEIVADELRIVINAIEECRPAKTVCEWVAHDYGLFSTSCGRDFEFTEDGVKENGFKFCPFCGGEIRE